MRNLTSNLKWARQAHFFEPQPCNFGKLDIFLRCSNDIRTIFCKSLWGQTWQKSQTPSLGRQLSQFSLDWAKLTKQHDW